MVGVGDHPRVCGEKQKTPPWGVEKGGSPPRMRGKADSAGCWASGCRITPAYAGKRYTTSRGVFQCKDHPRVCGEKPTSCPVGSGMPGSPPRMRGKDCFPDDVTLVHGITPAYAGKSGHVRQRDRPDQDHPRVCGEKAQNVLSFWPMRGSPPRMRGKD